MSSETILSKDNLDTFLKELSKEFRKLMVNQLQLRLL